MADLTNTVRWVRYVPDLRGNRELEHPFYLQLSGSLSKEQLRALMDGLNAPTAKPEQLPEDATEEQKKQRAEEMRLALVKRYADALTPHVRFGDEPLNIDGQKVESLQQYLDFCSKTFAGYGAFFEVSQALTESNMLDAASSFFSGRLSGGFGSTPSQPNGKAGNQRAVH